MGRITELTLISINSADSDHEKNIKRLVKMLLFEVFHEDALAAMPKVLEGAILRKAGFLTPFERMSSDGRKVTYFMQVGATTLAYVFRKLYHDFYDMPSNRFSIIVDPEYRSPEHIVEAAERLFNKLDILFDKKEITRLVMDDTGLPADYAKTIEKDNLLRSKQSVPLISSDKILSLSVDLFNKGHEEANNRDKTKEIKLVNFYREKQYINVIIRVPVVDERKSIETLISVPSNLFEIKNSISTVEAIRAHRRIIEIETGNYFSIETFKSDVLRTLSPSDYLFAIKAKDERVNEIIKVLKESGYDSIVLSNTSSNRLLTEVSPSYYITAKDDRSVSKIWNLLLQSGKNQEITNLRLDFKNPIESLKQELREFVKGKINISRSFEDVAVDRGFKLVSIDELQTRIIDGKIPISIPSPLVNDWNKLSESDRSEILLASSKIIDNLNPNKTVIIVNGEETELNRQISKLASDKKITLVSFVSEDTDISKINNIDYLHLGARAKPGIFNSVLQFLKSTKGFEISLNKSSIDNNRSALAKELEVKILSFEKKIKTGSHNFQLLNSNDRFSSSEEILSHIFSKNEQLINPDYRRNARDGLFHNYSIYLTQIGTDIVSYNELVQKAQGKKVVLINGYVNLGYENPQNVKKLIREMMRKNGDGVLYVGVGTFKGIGHMYEWIPEISKEFGYKDIKTSAIVSRNLTMSRDLAPMNYVHFVDTDYNNWRPISNEKDLQLEFARQTGGRLIAVGGGAITGEVVTTFLANKMRVEIYTGDLFQPNKENVIKAQKVRIDTIIDGLSSVMENFANSKLLKVYSDFPRTKSINLNRCSTLFN